MKGGKFTDKELKALTEYLKPDGRKAIDGFLTTISSDSPGIRIPDSIVSGDDFRSFIGQIEDLYMLLCKYGSTHEFPIDVLYAQDNNKIIKNDGGIFVEPRFKSLPINPVDYKGNIDSYITKNKSSMDGYQPFHVPFVDVREVLGEDSSESILLGPNQRYMYQEKKVNGRLDGEKRRGLSLEGLETSPRFSEEKHGITDAEFDVCVKYLRNQKADFTPEEFEFLRKMRNKIKTFVDSRLETIRAISMEKVLQVGDTITPEGMEHTDYLRNISDGIGEAPNPEMIITYEDLCRERYEFEGLKGGLQYRDGASFSSLTELQKRGIVPMSQNREISIEDVKFLLNARKQVGNRAVVELLASKGLLQDEVLSVGNLITPLGVESASFLRYEVGRLTPEEREGLVITTEYRDNKIKNLNYPIKENPESYDHLLDSGMSMVLDDEIVRREKSEAYSQLTTINSKGRLSPIMGDTEGFLQSISRRLGINLDKKEKEENLK